MRVADAVAVAVFCGGINVGCISEHHCYRRHLNYPSSAKLKTRSTGHIFKNVEKRHNTKPLKFSISAIT